VNSHIDWRKNKVIFRNKDKECRLLGLLMKSRDELQACATTLISRQQLSKAARSGGELFTVLSVQEPEEQKDKDDTTLPKIKALIDEFADVFPRTFPMVFPLSAASTTRSSYSLDHSHPSVRSIAYCSQNKTSFGSISQTLQSMDSYDPASHRTAHRSFSSTRRTSP
jgi:hypothetical protein